MFIPDWLTEMHKFLINEIIFISTFDFFLDRFPKVA